MTDSEAEVRYDEENKPGVSNLMNIYGAITGKDNAEMEREFAGKGYGDFKMAVGEAVADELAPLQSRYRELMTTEKAYLEECIKENDARASHTAMKTLRKVRRKVGLTDIPDYH